jgi:hypothetical protein
LRWWPHGDRRGECWGTRLGGCRRDSTSKPLFLEMAGGDRETAKEGRCGTTTALGRLPCPQGEQDLRCSCGLLVRGAGTDTHLCLGCLYSHAGCGNRLAQLLQGWPWLHCGNTTGNQHDALSVKARG